MNIREMHIIGPRCRERFLKILEQGSLAGLGVFLSGISDLQGRYCISRPRPAFDLTLGTLAGHARLWTEDGERRLNAGDILLAPAGCPYRYETESGRPWRIVWFHVWPPQGRESFRVIRIVPSEAAQKLAGAVEDLFKETAMASYLSLTARLARETDVSVILQRLWREGQKGMPSERYEVVLYQLWRRIMDELSRPWTLEEIAGLAGFSAGHLNRICRRHYGRPAMKHLAALRMEHAAHCLWRGELKISAIAALCGYANAFAFSVAFKRHFGCPPSRFVEGDGLPGLPQRSACAACLPLAGSRGQGRTAFSAEGGSA